MNNQTIDHAVRFYSNLDESQRDGWAIAFSQVLHMSVFDFKALINGISKSQSVAPINSKSVSANRPDDKIVAIAHRVEEALASLDIFGEVVKIAVGPRLLSVGFAVETNKLTDVQNKKIESNLAHCLGLAHVRVFSPFLISNSDCKYYRRESSSNLIGIEMPRDDARTVSFSEVKMPGREIHLPLCFGLDVLGRPYVVALEDLPHLLIGGSTGSGKSTGINSIICGLMSYASNFRILIIDLKRLDFNLYKSKREILVGGEIIENKKEAERALLQLQADMEWRLSILSQAGARNIGEYNSNNAKKLCYIVAIIDELSVLMDRKNAPAEVVLCDLAARSRAAGIHLVVATQRPSTEVITGDIKANFPSRLTYKMVTHHDSTTILGMKGAEVMLGAGDGLFMSPLHSGLHRLQCAYITNKDIEAAMERYNPKDIYYLPGVKVDREIRPPSNRAIQREYHVGFEKAKRIVGEWGHKKGNRRHGS